MSSTATRPRPSSAPRGGRPPGTRRPARRSPSWGVIVGVGLAALLAIAVLLTSGGDDPSLAQTAPVEVAGEALPTFTPGQVDPAVGLPAPALTGVSFDGSPVEVEPGRAPTVVVFAAHWCGYCQAEIAELSPWLAEGHAVDAGVEVRVVSTAVDPTSANYPPSSWFDREGWPGPVMADSDAASAASAYGLTGYPFFTFLDADGTVVARSSGSMGAEDMAAMVEALGATG